MQFPSVLEGIKGKEQLQCIDRQMPRSLKLNRKSATRYCHRDAACIVTTQRT